MNNFFVSSILVRWLVFLQEFDIKIVVKPGMENIVVDFLSRLTHGGEE